MNEPCCEFCKASLNSVETLYKAWFYTEAKNNPYAQGTASAGLTQLRIACKYCFNKMNNLGLTCKKEKIK